MQITRVFFITLVIIASLIGIDSHAQTSQEKELVGVWKAHDDSTGVVSFIELSIQDQELVGRILKIFDQNGNSVDPRCAKCANARKNMRVVGAVFIWGLRWSGDKWVGGKVIDIRPSFTQGIVANCELELVGRKARIFGYLGFRFLGASSLWDRVEK